MSQPIRTVTTFVTQTAESLLSIVGIRVGTEEPHYLPERLTDAVEIRTYGPRVAAETTVDGNEERARSIGFRRLANYIFGGNARSDRIDMTAPVAQSGERIAMTAPVAQSSAEGNAWAIRFFMPSKWTLETLPDPVDDKVRLVTIPGETVAVLRFSGDRGPQAVATRTGELVEALRDNGIDTSGDAVAWFYDPPWTLPFRRRNEIAVPIAR